MIKVSIIVAETADGFIAKETNHPALWTSKEDKKHFVEITKRAGVVIMGSTTWKTLPKPMKDRLNIVYTRSGETYEGAESTSIEPKELIDSLESRGFSEVSICGGSSIYTLFLKAGLVDTIYLTIEPILFGKGISIFNEQLELKLELQGETKTEAGTIFLEYKVIK